MKEKSQIKIFISYRRDGGIDTARWLHDQLRSRGYDVFLDMESLRAGAFNNALFHRINESDVFLMVLTKDCLKRCFWRNDWVRQELAYALRCGKKVIPLMKDDFEFPSQLPEDIDALRMQNGLRISFEFFDAFMNKLEEYILTDVPRYGYDLPRSNPYPNPNPRPNPYPNPNPRYWEKYLAAGLVGLVLLMGIFFGVWRFIGTPDPTEPSQSTTEPTEPEETTAPTEPEQTTAPTEPEQTTEPTQAHDPTGPQELGNTMGNLCNEGIITPGGVRSAGSLQICFLNEVDNWRYWYHSGTKTVKTHHNDNDTGADSTVLQGVDLSYLLVTTDWFYYTEKTGNVATLYRAPRLAVDQMGEPRMLVTGFSANNNMMIDGACAYYWYTGLGLYRLDLESGEETQLLNLEATWETDTFGMFRDWIYINTKTEIRRVNSATGEVQTLLRTADAFGDNEIVTCNVDEAWVYFALTDPGKDTHTHNDRVYRIHTDGSALERIFVLEGSNCSIRAIGRYFNSLLVTTGCADGQYGVSLDTKKYGLYEHDHEEGFAQTVGLNVGNNLSNLCNDAFVASSADGSIYVHLVKDQYIYFNRLDGESCGYYYDQNERTVVHTWSENGQGIPLLSDVLCHYLYVTPDWFYCVLEENGVNTLYRAENKPEEHAIGELEAVVSGFTIEENNIAIKDGYIYYWMYAEGLYRARTDGTAPKLIYSKGESISSCYGWHTFHVTREHLYIWVEKGGFYAIPLENARFKNLRSYMEEPGNIVSAIEKDGKIYYILRYDGDSGKTGPDEVWSINLDGTGEALLCAAPDAAMDLTQINSTMYSIMVKVEQEGQTYLYKISPTSGEMTLVKTYE